jgi:cytochrome c1
MNLLKPLPILLAIASCTNIKQHADTGREHIFDFGNITRGDSVIASFTVSNHAEKSIRINHISTPCSCSKISYDSTYIEPGKATVFSVKYKSDGDTGVISKSFVVATSGDADTLRSYFLRGYVKNKI